MSCLDLALSFVCFPVFVIGRIATNGKASLDRRIPRFHIILFYFCKSIKSGPRGTTCSWGAFVRGGAYHFGRILICLPSGDHLFFCKITVFSTSRCQTIRYPSVPRFPRTGQNIVSHNLTFNNLIFLFLFSIDF